MASVRGFLPLARRLLRFQVNASSAYSISFTAKYSVKSKSRFHVFDQMESIWTSQQLLFISTSAKDTLLYSTNEANGGFRRGGPTELIFEPPDEHSGYMQPQPGETSADQAKHKLRKHPTRIEREKRWYKNRIQKLSKRGELEEALDLFDDMLSSNLYPDVVVYNNLIAGLGRRGDMKKAFKLFNDMKKRALLPTDHTYTSLFNCCSVAGKRSLRYLQLVREEMERREVLPNSLTANAIIKAYAMCGEPTKAYEVYVKMSNWNCSPDLRTFSFLLMACAEDKDGGVAKCLHVWPEISANGFQPDVYSFNLLLRCLRDGGIPKDMLGPVEADDTVNLDLLTNSTDCKSPHCVDLSFGRGNSLKMVVRGNGRRFLPESSIVILLSLMSKHSATPNIKTFNLLLGLLFDIPSSENHFLWGLMKKHGIDIDVQLINEVVECHAMKGCMDKAENALSLMSKWDITADKDTYRAYGKGCAKEKDGVRLQEIMKSSGFSLDEEIFETVLRAAARQRQFSHMTALLKRMKELAVLPNAGTKSILAEIVERNSKDNLSGYVLKQFNGFKGYFNLWKSSMWIDDDGENPEIEE